MTIRVVDLALLVASGFLAASLRFHDEDAPTVLYLSLLLGVLVAAHTLQLLGVYRVQYLAQLHYQLPRVVVGWVVSLATLLVLLYLTYQAQDLSRLWIGTWLTGGCVALAASRLLLKYLIRRFEPSWLGDRLAVVGETELVDAYLGRLALSRTPVRVKDLLRLAPGVPVTAAELDALERNLLARQIDRVILASADAANTIKPVLSRLQHVPVEVAWAPPVPVTTMPVQAVSLVGGQPVMCLLERPIDGWRYLAKCGVDRCLGLFLLLLLSPAMLLIGLIVKLTSRGPALFVQERRGFNREIIKIYKFRSMCASAGEGAEGALARQAVRGDPRITPFGRLLRRTSLDELPQLINVLKGEMSIVGPRPHAIAHDTHYGQLIENYLSRHRVKPGITGWAQVNGHRGETDTVQKMVTRIEHDIQYIQTWSLLLDLKIIVRTLFVGFFHPEAR